MRSENLDEFIKFIVEKCEKADFPLRISKLFKEYKLATGTRQSEIIFQKKIQSLQKIIKTQDTLDIETKVKLTFGLGFYAKKSFLEMLRKNAIVVVDKYGRIVNYKSESLKLKRRKKRNSGDREEEEKVTRSGRGFQRVIPKEENTARSEQSQHYGAALPANPAPGIPISPIPLSSEPQKEPEFNGFKIPTLPKRAPPPFRSFSVAEPEHQKPTFQEPSVLPTPQNLIGTRISRRIHKSLLTSLQSMMISLDMQIPLKLEERFKKALNRIEAFEMMDTDLVTFSEIDCAISSCLLILAKCLSSSEERSISLRDFTLLFRNSLIPLKLPVLSAFENTLKIMHGMYSETDKKVSPETLQSALTTIFGILAP